MNWEPNHIANQFLTYVFRLDWIIWYTGAIRLLFFMGRLYVIDVCFGESQITNNYCYSEDWTTSSDFLDYSALNGEHREDDLWIQLTN